VASLTEAAQCFCRSKSCPNCQPCHCVVAPQGTHKNGKKSK